MLQTFLVPENTVVTAKGDGEPVQLAGAAGKTFLLTLTITRIVEQESLDVSVWGSADGVAFGEKALLTFPQKFYAGTHPLLLDLSDKPEIKAVRAHWEVARWGRGPETAMFGFQLEIREVPAEMLQEATTEAQARR